MSTERNIDDYYETNIRRFDPEMNKMFGMYRRHLAYLRPGMRVLEIGPGNGGFSAYIRGTFGLKSEDFTLLDISHTVVEALRANPETSSFHIEESDVVDFLEREWPAYDLIIMRHVLEHFEKKTIDRLLPLVESRLSSGGRLLVEVPNLANTLFGSYMAYGDYSHYTHFADKSLREAVQWNMKSCSVRCYNTFYRPFFSTNITLSLTFIVGLAVELFSAFFTLPTYAYGNRVFGPRLVAIITKK